MLGSRMKSLREELGMTQEELAEKLSISASAVGMYEKDLRNPNHELILKIADFFHCSIDYLFGRSEEKNFKKITFHSDEFYIDLYMGDCKRVTEEQKRKIQSYAKFVLKDNLKW